MKKTANISGHNGVVGMVKPAMKNMMWLAGGVAISAVITVSAQQYVGTAPSEPCVLNEAAQKAVNDHMSMIASTSTDPEKYFNQNCLGDLAFLSLDLSILIPDPLALLTSAAVAAVNKLKQAAINKICTAARNAIGDTIGRYNSAISQINGVTGNLGGAVTNYIDSNIAKQGQVLSDRFNLNYNTPVTNPDNAIPGGQTPTINTTTPVVNPPDVVIPSNPVTGPAAGSNAPISGSQSPTVAPPPAPVQTPAQPATVGSSIFGR